MEADLYSLDVGDAHDELSIGQGPTLNRAHNASLVSDFNWRAAACLDCSRSRRQALRHPYFTLLSLSHSLNTQFTQFTGLSLKMGELQRRANERNERLRSSQCARTPTRVVYGIVAQ